MTETSVEEKINGSEVKNGTEHVSGSENIELSPLEASIIRQVEYYFGDLNLPKDKFLQEQIKLDDGWIPFDIMLKFKRLANISSDPKAIADALAKSESSLMEVSEDGKKIRRSTEHPLPELNEERRLELMGRTIYVKGFPKEATIDTCIEFFKPHPETDGIILRKYKERPSKIWLFKGSVFVTFKTKEDAQKFLDLESVKVDGTETVRKWQSEYLEGKRAEMDMRKNKKNKKAEPTSPIKPQEIPQDTFVLPVGTVLHITDVTDKLTKESIREAVTDLGGDVAYVDFQMGDKEGWIRLRVENSAKAVIEKCKDGKISISNDDIAIKILEGDEEKQFLDRMTAELVKRRFSQKNHKNNKKKGGNKNYSKKRRSGRNDDDPRSKKEKTS